MKIKFHSCYLDPWCRKNVIGLPDDFKPPLGYVHFWRENGEHRFRSIVLRRKWPFFGRLQ